MTAAIQKLSLLAKSVGYEKILPHVDRIILNTASSNPRHIEAISSFLQANTEHNDLMAKLYPASNLTSQEKLKRVAAICGLQMPKTPTGISETSTICLEQMHSPFATRCGHSFCHNCISRHLEFRPSCPTCFTQISPEDLFPNFSLESAMQSHQTQNLESTVEEAVANISQLGRRIDALLARKRNLELEQKSVETRSMLEFLLTIRHQKQKEFETLSGQLEKLDRDILRAKQRIDRDSRDSQRVTTTLLNASEADPEVPVIQEDLLRAPKRPHLQDGAHISLEIPSITATSASTVDASCLLQEHYSDLQDFYFTNSAISDHLDLFSEKIAKISKMTTLRQVSAMKLGDVAGSSNIISSIEFNRDCSVFATAGVSKKIRLYEFCDALNTNMDLHCSVQEIQCKNKLSCISWNPYIHNQLASADYEGLISVYDVVSGNPISILEEHEKRCWSVDFSSTDPTRLASGSDDCFVKLWSMKSKKSICTIDGRANICSVRFHPEVGHLLAFGSADHNVHLYDLRYASKALDILKGHKKAVSYVRFANNSNIVSASTDCSLKLWSLPGGTETSLLPSATGSLVRSFSGHANEKNFVGLGVQGDLLACGSENNSVYVYHRDLTKPLASYKFPSTCPVTESSIENDVQQFVSSLTWKRDSNLLVAANSSGHIRLLELS